MSRTTPISAVHQIEMTSRCNLRCRYCVHPTMPRAKQDMDEDTYVKSLDWARQFALRGTQRELNLAGIGESTIHPQFIRFLELARYSMPTGFRITVTTNGVAVTEDMVREMAKYSPSVFVSLHRPEKAGPAIELFKKYQMLEGASADPSIAAINWAGQVKWHVSVMQRRDCSWMREGKVMVMADGRITRCSLDGSGAGVLGTINDDLLSLRTNPYSLCESCDQIPFKDDVQTAAPFKYRPLRAGELR